MSLVLNVEILGEFKNLTAATKGAQTSLNGLNKTTANISKKMTGALAAIGLGFSLRTAINELEEAGKAAIEDAKGMEILALAMKNTGSATDTTVKSAESAIKAMQLQFAVADDKLRPAYQKLFIATKDVTESNRLMQIALDASAATGKDLDVVTQAMAKALTGTDTALIKLIPSLKGSKTPIDDMAAAFAGAAEKAANVDPYQRMNVIFGEMQEQIGYALLPTLDKFSTWLSTPEGQEKIQGIIDLTIAMLGKFTDLTNFVIDNKDWIIAWGGVLAGVAVAIKAVNTAIAVTTGLKAAQTAATAAMTAGFTAMGMSAAGAATAVNSLYAALGLIAKVAGVIALILSLKGDAPINIPTLPGVPAEVPAGTGPLMPGVTPNTGGGTPFETYTGSKTGTTNNTVINVQSTQSAQDIAAILARSQKTNGTTVFRGL
jgi:hypothetical protein